MCVSPDLSHLELLIVSTSCSFYLWPNVLLVVDVHKAMDHLVQTGDAGPTSFFLEWDPAKGVHIQHFASIGADLLPLD